MAKTTEQKVKSPKSTELQVSAPSELPMEEQVKNFLEDSGFTVSKSASYQYIFTKNNFKIEVAYHIGSGKAICRIGKNTYSDTDMSYQIIVSKRDSVIASISVGDDSVFPLDDLKKNIDIYIKQVATEKVSASYSNLEAYVNGLSGGFYELTVDASKADPADFVGKSTSEPSALGKKFSNVKKSVKFDLTLILSEKVTNTDYLLSGVNCVEKVKIIKK